MIYVLGRHFLNKQSAILCLSHCSASVNLSLNRSPPRIRTSLFHDIFIHSLSLVSSSPSPLAAESSHNSSQFFLFSHILQLHHQSGEAINVGAHTLSDSGKKNGTLWRAGLNCIFCDSDFNGNLCFAVDISCSLK